MFSVVLCLGALGEGRRGVVTSVSQRRRHLRAGTMTAPSTITVLGILWGFNKEERMKGGFVRKLHIWEH